MKNKPHIANQIAEKFLRDWKMTPGMTPESIKEIIDQSVIDPSEQDELVILGCTLSGFAKSRQVYRFQPELIKSLASCPKMDFNLRDLHLPFLSMYFDIGGYPFYMDDNKVLGMYVHVCMPPNPFIFFLAVCQNKNDIRIAIASMEYLTKASLTESIEQISGDINGDKELCTIVCLMLSYISSEEPDVKNCGIQVALQREYGKKLTPSSIRLWEVGYRYIKEHPAAQSQPNTTSNNGQSGTHASPRAHMRRGHWHTYLCGKEHKKRVVKWVAECAVGKGESVTTVRCVEVEEKKKCVCSFEGG